MSILKFSANKKVRGISELLDISKNSIWSFGIPAGFTCPKAKICQSFANRETGKIKDGANCKYRCYAASLECAFTATRKMRWQNFDAIKFLSTEEIAQLIISEIPKKTKVIRIHDSGDFFSFDYFKAWVKVAKSLPDIIFFGYTKILAYVQYDKPDNFYLTYSMGGKDDKLHTNEPYARIVESEEHAKKLGIEPACVKHHSDDIIFIMARKSFGLIVHGVQPKGSKLGNNSLKLKLKKA